MTERDQQLERLREAVDRKAEAAEEASHSATENPRTDDDVTLGPTGRAQPGIYTDDRTQDEASARDKNTGHGKKTADKWNQ